MQTLALVTTRSNPTADQPKPTISHPCSARARRARSVRLVAGSERSSRPASSPSTNTLCIQNGQGVLEVGESGLCRIAHVPTAVPVTHVQCVCEVTTHRIVMGSAAQVQGAVLLQCLGGQAGAVQDEAPAAEDRGARCAVVVGGWEMEKDCRRSAGCATQASLCKARLLASGIQHSTSSVAQPSLVPLTAARTPP